MDETQAAALPVAAVVVPVDAESISPTVSLTRLFALLQVLLICGIPTQIVIAIALQAASGQPVLGGDGLSLQSLATISLIDTAVVALLIRLFLVLSGESSATVFLGRRAVGGEILRGLALVPVVLVGVTTVVLGVRALAPWTHTVERSPLEAFMRSPVDAAIFMVVVVLAGGVREELQRAFILHRFEQRLGGARAGLVIFSAAFGALHLNQGLDVALTIGLLGFLWGVSYIGRRSAVLAMANHAGFNAAQVMQVVVVRAIGG